MKEKVNIRLFPTYFKKIGLIIIVLEIVVYLLQLVDLSFWGEKHQLFYDIWSNVLIIGLFLAAFAKEKIEDERISQIRYKVLSFVFRFGVLITVFSNIFNMFVETDLKSYKHYEAQSLIILLLAAYLLYFNEQKRI